MAAEPRYIGDEDYQEVNAIGDEVARMTVGLIKYLLRSDRRDRGSVHLETTAVHHNANGGCHEQNRPRKQTGLLTELR